MPTPSRARKAAAAAVESPIVVRRSKVHGLGVFAARVIRKGEVIDEYTGERISHAAANRRYRHRDVNDNHTFLFTVSSRTVIDATRQGNDTRFINHRCDPNCEPRIRRGRVFIVAIRTIRARRPGGLPGAGQASRLSAHANAAA